MSKSYIINHNLAFDIYSKLDDTFKSKYPNFINFLEQMINEDTKLKIHKSSDDRKQSLGHTKIYSLFKSLYPNHRIEQNVTLPITFNCKKTTLEFDVVNFTLKIIFEIQGDHHKKFVKHFHKTIENFTSQIGRDDLKKDWAKLNGWLLIQISDKDAKKMESINQLSDLIVLEQNKDE